jgi:hypothetical protein
MIKADLKHWGGRRGVNGPYEIDYKRFARQAHNKLGDGGVVGIPNARGPDNPLKAEYRFEELFKLAEQTGSITKLGDGRVFHDEEYDIWFVKSQEVNSMGVNGKKLTYLVFNIPFGRNVNEKDNEAFTILDKINVLNLPSCIGLANEGLYSHLWGCFSGIIVHSSSAEVLKGVNEKAEEFYNEDIKGNSFPTLYPTSHQIGALSVSGGHRTPKESLLQKVISPISIGSSYTFLPQFEGGDLNDFNYWLKTSIENSQDTNLLVEGSNKREMLSKHLPRMVQEVLNGRRKSLYNS